MSAVNENLGGLDVLAYVNVFTEESWILLLVFVVMTCCVATMAVKKSPTERMHKEVRGKKTHLVHN